MFDLEPALVRVRFDDDEEHTIQTIAFCVANARYFGGGMFLAPNASINDGSFDVINLGDISAAKFLINALSIYRGTHQTLPEINSKLAKRIEISAVDESKRVMLEIDGELPGELPAIYEIIPNALSVRVSV